MIWLTAESSQQYSSHNNDWLQNLCWFSTRTGGRLVNNLRGGQRFSSSPSLGKEKSSPTFVTRVVQGSTNDTDQQEGVQSAELTYRPLLSIVHPLHGPQTLLLVNLHSGRKHQIRVQLSHLGHPILGDVKYGSPRAFKDRSLALHSLYMSLEHPTSFDPSKVQVNVQLEGRQFKHGKSLTGLWKVMGEQSGRPKLRVVAPLPESWSKRMGNLVVDAVNHTARDLLLNG